MAASHWNADGKRSNTPPAASLIALAFVVVACGRHETPASRSAAAYDEAQRKGTPVAKGEHGGHATPAGDEQAGAAPPEQHAGHAAAAAASSARAGADHSSMPGMDHAQRGKPGAAASDHSTMSGMEHPKMAGMDHSPAAGNAHSNMTETRHSKPAATDHAAMGHGEPMPPPAPEPATASAQPGQPAATLRVDELDGPAPTARRDAERAQAMAKELANGHAMQHGSPYRQLDAGRDPAASPSPAPKPSPHVHDDSR
jgi:hypothetical protein